MGSNFIFEEFILKYWSIMRKYVFQHKNINFSLIYDMFVHLDLFLNIVKFQKIYL